jgi:hypothetical protein
LRKGIVGLLLCLSCLGSSVWAQSAAPQEQLFNPMTPPAGLLGPGTSVSDANMPVPEGGVVADRTYRNRYFGFSYGLPPGWEESLEGPPPSDAGYYVLGQFKHMDTSRESIEGTILITASDMFFSRPVGSAKELIESMKATLKPVYEIEALPTDVKLGDHTFTRFDYQAPAAELHWRILATEIRCHIVEFVLTSRDTRLLETLIQSVDRIQLSAPAASGSDGNEVPLCIQDYASGSNLVHRVDPSFAGPRFTSIPARIVIDRNGKVRFIHVISAFPAQAENVKAALAKWEFKPYVRNGRPLEVEAGILFEFPPRDRELQGQSPHKAGPPH